MSNYYDAINESIELLNSSILRQYTRVNLNQSSLLTFNSWLDAIIDIYLVDFKNGQ